MRHPDTKRQLDAAVNNVESALKNLAERLDDALPGRRRSRIERAGRAVRRRANSVADRVSSTHASSFLTDTERTVREHPVRVVLTAAVAGYCVWALMKMSNGR